MNKKVNPSSNIRIERVWSMPNKNTFEICPIKNLINEEVDESLYWIDPFANRNKIATVTNDLNPDYDTDYHLDALEFLKLFEDGSVDGVLYDPPYSPRQVSECYNNVGYNVTWDTTKASFWGNHKREISRIVKIGGKVITFGWNSGGIGYKYGFEIQRILLVPHGGWHNDTICTVEVKTHEGELQTPPIQYTLFQQGEPMKPQIDINLIEKLQKLPSDYWDFREDDTKEYTHGIHNYPAMMVCPISRNIIRLVKELRPVHALFDPFAGSGTVLVEGMLAEIDTVAGNDINPLAIMLSQVKTTPLDMKVLNGICGQLLNRIETEFQLNSIAILEVDEYIETEKKLDISAKKGWGDNAPKYLKQFCIEQHCHIKIPDFKNLGYWFKPQVILILSLIKAEIDQINDIEIRNFVLVAFSETIRLVSNRRNGEFKMFRIPANKVQEFNPNVFQTFREILNRNIEKMQDFCNAIHSLGNISEVKMFTNSTCHLEDVPNDTYDLIVTSPPYGDSRTTVAYGEYSRLSLQWINQENMSEREIMSVDRSLMGGKKYRNGFEFTLKSQTLLKSLTRIKDIDLERAGDVFSFYADLDAAIRNIAMKTTSGGLQFWVVGNRTVKEELLQTDVIITELSEQYGLTHVYTIDRNIPNKVMPLQNSPTNITGKKSVTMTKEHIVILRKK